MGFGVGVALAGRSGRCTSGGGCGSASAAALRRRSRRGRRCTTRRRRCACGVGRRICGHEFLLDDPPDRRGRRVTIRAPVHLVKLDHGQVKHLAEPLRQRALTRAASSKDQDPPHDRMFADPRLQDPAVCRIHEAERSDVTGSGACALLLWISSRPKQQRAARSPAGDQAAAASLRPTSLLMLLSLIDRPAPLGR